MKLLPDFDLSQRSGYPSRSDIDCAAYTATSATTLSTQARRIDAAFCFWKRDRYLVKRYSETAPPPLIDGHQTLSSHRTRALFSTRLAPLAPTRHFVLSHACAHGQDFVAIARSRITLRFECSGQSGLPLYADLFLTSASAESALRSEATFFHRQDQRSSVH